MKNKKIIGVVVAASLVGLSASFAKQTDTQTTQPGSPRAQEQQSGQSSQIQPPSPGAIQDSAAGASTANWNKETFIKEVAQNGVAEVNMAQIGTTKAQDPGLKEVAQRLVTDHSKLNDQIKELASKKGITLSTEINQKHQKMIDHLSGLSGAEFDKAFAMHMVQGHKKSIAKFKQAAAQTEDTDVQELAKNTLPTLQEHLTLVQKYAPETSAGAAVEEPAGAQKSDQQKQDSSSQDSSKPSSPDSSQSPDQSATPKK